MSLDQTVVQHLKKLNEVNQKMNKQTIHKAIFKNIFKNIQKCYIFDQNLKTLQNNKMIELLLNLSVNQQRFFKQTKNQIQEIFKGYNQYTIDYLQIGLKSIEQIIKENNTLNQIQEACQNKMSEINFQLEILSKKKMKIVEEMQKKQVQYSRYICQNGGKVQFQMLFSHNKKSLQMYQFVTHKTLWQVQRMNLSGHNFKLQGLQILTSMYWPYLKSLNVWRNDISTLKNSGLQKLPALEQLSVTFNPLKVDTVEYLLSRTWQKIFHLRIQFLDGNTSWPLLAKKLTTYFPKMSIMRIGRQGGVPLFGDRQEELKQETIDILKALQKKYIKIMI